MRWVQVHIRNLCYLRFLVLNCGLCPGYIAKVKCGWRGFNCGHVVLYWNQYVLWLMSSIFYSNYLFLCNWACHVIAFSHLILRHDLHWIFLLQTISKQNLHGSCHWHRLIGAPDTWICSCKRWRILLQCFAFDL